MERNSVVHPLTQWCWNLENSRWTVRHDGVCRIVAFLTFVLEAPLAGITKSPAWCSLIRLIRENQCVRGGERVTPLINTTIDLPRGRSAVQALPPAAVQYEFLSGTCSSAAFIRWNGTAMVYASILLARAAGIRHFETTQPVIGDIFVLGVTHDALATFWFWNFHYPDFSGQKYTSFGFTNSCTGDAFIHRESSNAVPVILPD